MQHDGRKRAESSRSLTGHYAAAVDPLQTYVGSISHSDT